MLTIPAAGAVAASRDRVTSGSVLTVARLRAARSVVMSVARHIALVAGEPHATPTLTSHWITDGVASTPAMTGAVLTVAASRTRYQHITIQSETHFNVNGALQQARGIFPAKVVT